MTVMDRVIHTIPPVFNAESRILILGSFPSIKSRQGEFFYHHPQNRFWKIISSVCEEPLPESIEEKRAMLLQNRIAVWDVIQSCEITGSSDSSIKNVVPNDLTALLNTTKIKYIIANGNTAYQLYMKYIFPQLERKIIKMPSTSPANAAYNVERLLKEWSMIKTLE